MAPAVIPTFMRVGNEEIELHSHWAAELEKFAQARFAKPLNTHEAQAPRATELAQVAQSSPFHAFTTDDALSFSAFIHCMADANEDSAGGSRNVVVEMIRLLSWPLRIML